MKTFESHKINTCNELIEVTADEPDPQTGASAAYHVRLMRADGSARMCGGFRFHTGLLGDDGPRGITNEVLLAIVMDRLEGFQSGPFACEQNAGALKALEVARAWLAERTRVRQARGVEGTREL